MNITREKASILGLYVIRAGLVINLGWQGLGKFTAAEAEGIEPLISRSPLMSWTLDVAPLRGVSATIGVVELLVTVLLVAGLFSKRANDLAVIGAAVTFLGTSSFLLTSIDYSFGLLPPNGFLLKDIVLLGASLALANSAPAFTRTADRVTA